MFYQKCKKGITIVLILAIIMGGLLPACSVSAKRKAVAFTKKNFPDPALRQVISEEIGFEPGEKIPQNKSLKGVTLDHLSEDQMASLSSIRTKKLTLKNLDIEKLELTDAKNVKELEIVNCHCLKQISLQGCKNLKDLYIKKSENLQDILIEGSNKLENLALSDCPVLKSMESFRKLPLKYLTIENTSIKDFRAKNFPDLEYLLFSGNPQNKMEVSSLKKLWHLEVVGERMTKKLDVSKMSKLEDLIWRYGTLKKIKFGKNKKLSTIDVSGNRLSGALDLGAYKKLETVVCNDNKITSLTFGKHSDDLTYVYCRNNKIKIMKASYAINLRNIDCRGNKGIKVYLLVDSEEDCNDWKFGKTAKVYFGVFK